MRARLNGEATTRTLVRLILPVSPFVMGTGSPQVEAGVGLELVEAAQTHGLAPLLHHALSRSGQLDALPSQAREALQRARWQATASNAMTFRELGRLLELLESNNIPVVVLKGAALAATLYPAEDLRPLTDLDLLVRDSDRARLCDTLCHAGYVPQGELDDGTSFDFAAEQTFSRRGIDPLDIDVHTHLIVSGAYRRRVPIQWFWDHASPAFIRGHTACILDPLAQCLHLSTHLALHHYEGRLIWSYDLALLLHRYSAAIDWHGLLAAAEQFGLAQPLFYALRQVVEFWQAPLPPALQSWMLTRRARPQERLAFAVARARERQARGLWDGLRLPGARAKARFFARHLFPSREFMRLRYGTQHAYLVPLYYGWRLVSGAYKLARSAKTIVDDRT